jgi:hypothetical protein
MIPTTGPEQASPQSASSNNQAPSLLVVGLCSAAGALTSLSLLFCLARRYLGITKDHSSMYAKSGTCLDENLVKCNLELSADVLGKENADKNCDTTCPNQISEADYSKEFEDVLELMARLAINIKSLVDPLLRKDLEATVQHSNELTR